jgi:hypothetical protein
LNHIKSAAASAIGVSDWIRGTPDRIDLFAEVTHDGNGCM